MHAENPLRKLPSVQHLLELAPASDMCVAHGRAALTSAIRAVLDDLRGEIARGASVVPDGTAILERAEKLLTARSRSGLRPVINATGIVLHSSFAQRQFQDGIDSFNPKQTAAAVLEKACRD